MKIAVFHELHYGGAKRAANEIAKELKKNHIVDLYIVDSTKPDQEKDCYNSIYFYQFFAKKWNGGDWKVRLQKDSIELLKLYSLHKKIAIDINAKKYDAIIVHPSKFTQAPFILKFIRTKKIYYCQEPLRMAYDNVVKSLDIGFFNKLYEIINRSLRKYIDKKNISYADIVLANSRFSQKNIYKAYDIPSKICYLGVDLVFFKPFKKKKDIDILYIGSESHVEGFDVFKSIYNKLSNYYKIIFLNTTKKWLTEQELRLYYQRSKIVLCLSRNEPFGLIPLEAGACGCVTIALNQGGYKDTIINGKNGFLIQNRPFSTFSIIQKILNDKKMLISMSKFARKNVEKNWNWQLTGKRLLSLLNYEEKS